MNIPSSSVIVQIKVASYLLIKFLKITSEKVDNFVLYTEFAVDLCIASPFSRHIAIINAGPTSALESMGAQRSF